MDKNGCAVAVHCGGDRVGATVRRRDDDDWRKRVAFGFLLVPTAAVSEAEQLVIIVVPTRASSQRERSLLNRARVYDDENRGGGE